jgi:hypothetical protein
MNSVNVIADRAKECHGKINDNLPAKNIHPFSTTEAETEPKICFSCKDAREPIVSARKTNTH